MNNDWHGLLRLSLVHYMAFPEAAEGKEVLLKTLSQVIEDDFFATVELAGIQDAALRRQIRAMIEPGYMSVGYGAQTVIVANRLDLNAVERDKRRVAIDALNVAMDEAKDLGADFITICSGPDPGEGKRGPAMGYLKESLVGLCEYAQRLGGLVVGLETWDREVDKRYLVGPSDLAASLAAEIREDYPDFGIVYNLAHAPLFRESMVDAVRNLRGYLVHAYIGNNLVSDRDNPLYGDRHIPFGVPGSENDVGTVVRFLRELFSIGYLSLDAPLDRLPTVGIEVKPLPGHSSGTALANSKRVWRQAWARV
jgi:sugar phosphate isomerase/epimerase